ncbi:sensor histidine kinase [Microbacterium sp. A84]|uniref:sensor histidine kinase n=1 Tax=Microbacterium sp. A84 TaxID=3450715 RepID=UPI003F41FF25
MPETHIGGGDRVSFADMILVGAYVLIAVGLGCLSIEAPHDSPLWVMLVLLAGGVATLLVRRRWPAVAFAAALVLTLLSFAAGSAAEAALLVIALIELGVTRSGRAAWLGFMATAFAGIAGAGILANRARFGPAFWGAILPLATRDLVQAWLSSLTIIVVIALIATLLGVNIGHRRRFVATLVERAEQMKHERDQQARIASAQERERIAREMHDVIAHSLAVMIAVSDGAQAIAIRRPEEAQEAIRRVAETGRRTLDEVRLLLGTVRGDDSDSLLTAQAPQPSIEQLPALIEEFLAAGLPVNLETTGSAPADPVTQLTVYRIVQESLTNVLRHANDVRGVRVLVVLSTTMIEISVEDSSAIAATPRDPGRGLLGIRERAAIYDGIVETGPRTAGGWRVFVRLMVGEK